MFISVLELFKVGIGPSSSHTLGPLVAAGKFIEFLEKGHYLQARLEHCHLRCTLKGSLAYTGKGHATDQAITLGLHGYTPYTLLDKPVASIVRQLWKKHHLCLGNGVTAGFIPEQHIIFDCSDPLPEHPNGLIFELIDNNDDVIVSETYFSIGGGFVNTRDEIANLHAPLQMLPLDCCSYPFDSAALMLQMAEENNLSVAEMKKINELDHFDEKTLMDGMDAIWNAMQRCLKQGLDTEGILPGGLGLQRRAANLYRQLLDNKPHTGMNDWLCAYAMAVNEENAAGHMVVTAPTNGAAGVIPAVLYYFVQHENGSREQIHEFLLTASAIGGLIKHRSSISGAEVGCQGEVGSAAAMAAAGLCAVRGGTAQQVENAAEIALEHHLGLTCDPVRGLVQVPCIERNGFGAVKACTAASLALRGSGQHFMPLDSCIAAMKQTGMEMSHKYKETSLGGLAVSYTEC